MVGRVGSDVREIRRSRTDSAPTRVAPSGITGFNSVVDELRRLYADGDTAAALDLAAMIQPPAALPSCLSLDAVPRIAMPVPALQKLPLDHRAGFLLACVDGVSTLGAILEVMGASGMPEPEAVATLESLIAFGAVEMT